MLFSEMDNDFFVLFVESFFEYSILLDQAWVYDIALIFLPNWFQGEIHELLALVYYDGLQNVVPFYDQRSVAPLKDTTWEMFCKNSMNHFKKAFKHKYESFFLADA